MANSAADVIRIAAAEVGYSRWSDPEAGTKYGRWYAEQTGSSYYGTSGVPYCAMFVSWVMARAGARCEGIPGAYCPWIVNAGRKAGKLVSAANAKAGDVVLFDWEGDGTSDHVGFVERNSGGVLRTIEGNTNNGAVARRTRSYGTVCGVIRPDYDGTAANAPEEDGGEYEVDGVWGPDTTRGVQAALGTTQDGIVSDQYAGYRASNPGLSSASWEWHGKTSLGSDMVRALQRKVDATVDGVAGPKTFRALQAYLGTAQDGCISNPSACVKALQKRLNEGTF